MGTDIGFVNDTNQAESFISANLRPSEIFSFCPAAAYLLKKHGLNVKTPAFYYTSLAQGKNAVYSSKRAQQIVETVTPIYKLNTGEAAGLEAYLKHYLPVVYYNYYSVVHYPGYSAGFYTVEKGKVVKKDNFRELMGSLVGWTISRFNSYENTKYSRLNYWLCHISNKLVLAFYAKNKFRVAHFGNSTQFKKLLAEIEKKKEIAQIHSRKMPRSSGQAVKFLLGNLKKIFLGNKNNKPVFYFRAYPQKAYDLFEDDETLKKAIKDIFHEQPLQNLIADEVARYIPFLKAQYAIGINFTDEVKPDLLLTDHVIYNFIRGAFDRANQKNIPAIIINQGSHTKQTERLSAIAANLWASTGRVVTSSATHFASKLALTYEHAKELEPNLPPNFIKIAPYPHLALNQADPNQKFTVLVASNYSGPDFHMPRITETAEEFLLGICEIIEELGNLENIEVIIKLKIKKAPIHAEILRDKIQDLGLEDKVKIDTHGKFPEVLARSHLVISNLSAALEEALAAPVPLILYSYRKKYFHLPCSFEPGISFVYGAKSRHDLPKLVEAIRLNYKEITQNKPGLDKIVWQDSELTDIFAISQQILAA